MHIAYLISRINKPQWLLQQCCYCLDLSITRNHLEMVWVVIIIISIVHCVKISSRWAFGHKMLWSVTTCWNSNENELFEQQSYSCLPVITKTSIWFICKQISFLQKHIDIWKSKRRSWKQERMGKLQKHIYTKKKQYSKNVDILNKLFALSEGR